MPEDDPTRNRRENKGADPASCKTLQGPRAFKVPPWVRGATAFIYFFFLRKSSFIDCFGESVVY